MSKDPICGCQTLYGIDNEHSSPYMTRLWFGRLRLHIFHRGDADPDCHDHPWPFWTFPLTPYVEEVALPVWTYQRREDGSMSVSVGRRLVRISVPAWCWTHREASHAHRVLGPDRGHGSVGRGRIITLVWRGKSGRRWGFLRNRDGEWCWTPWREYIFGGGKNAPCGPTESRHVG